MSLGVVIIGRNEGERLTLCLESALKATQHVVYVDSGSSDDSVGNAKSLGALVVSLDLSLPFTAARARNIGWRTLLEQHPEIQYLQFVDGDCELCPEWIPVAREFLENNPEFAVTCGRRLERYPQRSIYNQLCDIEWNTPIGEALACGGDAMFTASSLVATNGYRDDVIAGEEPELCVRLRQQGKKYSA
jgi:Glycosyltransferases involved in cell wall biogenesis